VAGRGPSVSFEVRDFHVSSPDWRGKFLPRLQVITREQGSVVWILDQAAYEQLIENCAADPRSNVIQAPRMLAPIGGPARMSSEETVHYVAAVKRVADGPPNQATRLAFEPQTDKIHIGVRVNVLSSELKERALYARMVIEENRLVTFHTATYSELVRPKGGADSGVVRTSLLDRLNPTRGPAPAAVKAAIQVPEVNSRRIEGEWLIPSTGALLVSLGPRSGTERGFLKTYDEHMVAITAQPLPQGSQPDFVQPAMATPAAR
jgi:hypothetical protein